MFFLVVDERTMIEFGRHLMIGKLTRPCVVTSTDYSIPTIFKGIKKNALIIVDNTRLQNLVTAVATAVDGGYFHRCGVVLLLDSSVAANNDELTRLNIRMRALWSAEASPSSSPGPASSPEPARGILTSTMSTVSQLGSTRG